MSVLVAPSADRLNSLCHFGIGSFVNRAVFMMTIHLFLFMLLLLTKQQFGVPAIAEWHVYGPSLARFPRRSLPADS